MLREEQYIHSGASVGLHDRRDIRCVNQSVLYRSFHNRNPQIANSKCFFSEPVNIVIQCSALQFLSTWPKEPALFVWLSVIVSCNFTPTMSFRNSHSHFAPSIHTSNPNPALPPTIWTVWISPSRLSSPPFTVKLFQARHESS